MSVVQLVRYYHPGDCAREIAIDDQFRGILSDVGGVNARGRKSVYLPKVREKFDNIEKKVNLRHVHRAYLEYSLAGPGREWHSFPFT
jgi:hypothetical protein